jgi:hypothetical protein
MYRHLDSVGFQDHFRFLSAATAQLLATGRSYSFGDTGLHSPESIHRKLVRYQRKIQQKDR